MACCWMAVGLADFVLTDERGLQDFMVGQEQLGEPS